MDKEIFDLIKEESKLVEKNLIKCKTNFFE